MTPAAPEILVRTTAPESDPEPAPKALLVFAHPDDETVAVGARLGRFRHARFLQVTDGAPRDEDDARTHGFRSWMEYRDARAGELAAMLHLAGVDRMSHECLNIPDQQATLHLPQLTRQIAERIREVRPAVVLTHPYEGGHPDHDACTFAVHHACEMPQTAATAQPLIMEAAFYHAGGDFIESEAFLPPPNPVPEIARPLSPQEQARKRRRLQCFATQQETLALFACAVERYRIAPRYDFTRPATTGPALFDHFPWGMTTGRFCQLAAEAIDELRKEVPGI